MPSNSPSPLLPQDLCPGRSLSLSGSSLTFSLNWFVPFRSQPNGTSSEKPSLNSQAQPSLAETQSVCPQKCCAASSPNPHIQPLLQAAFPCSGWSDRLPTRDRPPSTRTRGITEVWTLKPACWGSSPASATCTSCMNVPASVSLSIKDRLSLLLVGDSEQCPVSASCCLATSPSSSSAHPPPPGLG